MQRKGNYFSQSNKTNIYFKSIFIARVKIKITSINVIHKYDDKLSYVWKWKVTFWKNSLKIDHTASDQNNSLHQQTFIHGLYIYIYII